MVSLRHTDTGYCYYNYTVEQFDGRWYVFDGAEWVADFGTLNEVRVWLGE